MRQQIKIAALVAVAGACVPALAQDSTSNAGGLPGDALSPWTQRDTAYIVDLSPIVSTQGHVFGVAPLIKTNATNPTFFNNLPSTSTFSPDLLQNVLFSSSSYLFWSTPGSGINIELNNGGQAVDASKMLGSQFAVAHGNIDLNIGFNGVVGAIVNYDPADANRLFVSRKMAAVNMTSASGPQLASFAGYSVDANGNLYFSASENGVTDPAGLTGDNLYRTRMASLSGVVDNLISDNNANMDATDRLQTNSPTTTPAANMMPASIAGGNGLVAVTNFNTEYVYGGSAPLSADSGYVDTTISGSVRGKLSSTSFDILGVGAAHAQSYGQLTKPIGSNETSVFNIHAVDSTGARIAKQGFALPLTTDIVDNDDGFTINYSLATPEFTNYHGAATFNGVGHIALGSGQDGKGLMAATIHGDLSIGTELANQILVARYDSVAGTTEWTMAAWVDFANLGTPNEGKAIFDAGGVQIGQLVNLLPLTGAGGPSMSAPAIDSAGNIWFMGAVELFDRLPNGDSDFDGAILRAIYDPATFSYRLEMVLEVGQQIDGLNSGRKYRINFLGTADGQSNQAVSTIWTSSLAEGAWNDSDISAVEPSDPITNGGLIAATQIVYDVDEDGIFDADAIGSVDEEYQVGFYIGYYQDDEPNPCPADLAAPFGTLNLQDVFAYLALFNANDPAADLAAPFGTLNLQDVFAYLALFNAGCP